jgi:hypothetical protein
MSYEKPDEIPKEQINNAIIWHTTSEVIRELSDELKKVGLTLHIHHYFKNEYCGNRPYNCSCPHWIQMRILSNFEKIYHPHCYIILCKRKRVFEIRYKGMVDNNFWINTKTDRTQGSGYIHSYGLKQAAEDIAIIYQAAEIHDYKSKNFKECYEKLFWKEKKGN